MPFPAMPFLEPILNLRRGEAKTFLNVIEGYPILSYEFIDPYPRYPESIGEITNGQ